MAECLRRYLCHESADWQEEERYSADNRSECVLYALTPSFPSHLRRGTSAERQISSPRLAICLASLSKDVVVSAATQTLGRRFKVCWRGLFSRRKVKFIGLLLFPLFSALLAALAALVIHRSFSRVALKKELESAISGRAEIKAFHRRYFPPGCVAEGVSLHHGSRPELPLIVIGKPSIQSTVAGLISGRRVSIRADG